jgi:hypothetical protein
MTVRTRPLSKREYRTWHKIRVDQTGYLRPCLYPDCQHERGLGLEYFCRSHDRLVNGGLGS